MKTNFSEERRLIDGLIAGEIAAYKEIYTRYYKPLCVYAFRMIEDESESEDIVQGLIQKLWENRQTVGNIKNLKSYLYRSVHNGVINILNLKEKLF